MALVLHPYDGNGIIYAEMQETTTLSDAQEMNAFILQHLETTIRQINLVLDIRSLKKFPTNMREINKIYTYQKHPNFGWVIMINKLNPMLNYFAEVVSQMSQSKMKSVKTLKQAQDTLAIVDNSAKWNSNVLSE